MLKISGGGRFAVVLSFCSFPQVGDQKNASSSSSSGSRNGRPLILNHGGEYR